ncbi:MAG: hypothetical protein AB8H86_12640 [Polyangiales bacterium]
MPTWTHEALAFAALGLLLVLSASLAYRSGQGKRNAARARRLGKRGESRAKKLLIAKGYRVLDTQTTKALTFLVDGKKVTTHLRADFLLERRGRRYVADAKAGEKAPSATNAATRRQLLEYATAYDVDGVLLVDASGGNILSVEFPALQKKRRPRHVASLFFLLLVAALVGFGLSLGAPA